MAARSGNTPAQPRAERRPDTAELDIKLLAKAILAREFRPRVSEIRRLAEAALKKKKKGKKADGKKRKLSKIPARKHAS